MTASLAAQLLSPLLMAAAATGLGAAALFALGLVRRLGPDEAPAFAFALGLGILGWLVFPLAAAGWADRPVIAIFCVIGAAGVLLLPRPRWPATLTGGEVAVVTLIAVALAFDLMEGLSPPADADSLAYHFAIPKQAIESGRLSFVPRAVSGAAPMTVQMTYLAVLAIGGERALTLWTMLSGWAVSWLVFLLARRHLSRPLALAVALVMLTTPAVVYGGGSGHVEIRIALFVLIGAFALAATRADGGEGAADLGWTALAGLAAGFYAGSKYTGLLFVAVAALVLVAPGPWFRAEWLRRGLAFGSCVLLAGAPWYLWNYIHSGDPVFPLLYDWLGYDAAGLWDQAHAAAFQMDFGEAEKGVPVTLFWLLTYPVKAILAGAPEFESGRTGLGPFALLIAPFALAGAWQLRHRLRSSPLGSVAAIAVLFYALWFLTGSSQRIRHLLPVWPLVLICLTVAAARFAPGRRALWAAFVLTAALQLGGHALFTLAYARHLASGESREAFHARTVSEFAPVPWLNANLGPETKLFHQIRQYNYLLEVPYFSAHGTLQALIDVTPAAHDAARFLRQLRRQGVTHLLVAPGSPAERLTRGLLEAGCASPVRAFEARRLDSRTLPGLRSQVRNLKLVVLDQRRCGL